MSSAKWWSFCLGLNVSSAMPVCIWKPTLALTSPKDIFSPNDAKPLAGTVISVAYFKMTDDISPDLSALWK